MTRENSFLSAKSQHPGEDRDRLKRMVAQRGLCGLANDTKWDEFITAIRTRDGYRPRYRTKCIDGQPSFWDAEWFYHLPFPLISVEWLDLAFMEHVNEGLSLPHRVVDHSPWLTTLCQEVGLDSEKGKSTIRIFGYSPKDFDGFE